MASSTAILACSDLQATLAHYRDVLGFTIDWTWGDPASFGSASMDGATLMFSLQPVLAAKVRGHQHWIRVDDADELHRVHLGNGASIVSGIEDKPWGVREYVVEDPNGYHLRFAGPPSSEAPRSRPFPEGVTLERRKPTAAEFSLVAGAAFGYQRPVEDLLDRTWNGVVAVSPEGAPIGVLRLVWDAPGWYSVWDVAVTPEWQAQRIGSAMMRQALDMVAEVSPGAFVYLFTFKHGFYERLGFATQTVSMRRV